MRRINPTIRSIVEEACKKETNKYGYGIWSHHILLVVKYGKLLAKKLEADPEIVEIAALLHDYGGIKDESFTAEHHLHSAQEADKILRSLGYPEDTDNCCQAVHCLSSGEYQYRETNGRGGLPC